MTLTDFSKDGGLNYRSTYFRYCRHRSHCMNKLYLNCTSSDFKVPSDFRKKMHVPKLSLHRYIYTTLILWFANNKPHGSFNWCRQRNRCINFMYPTIILNPWFWVCLIFSDIMLWLKIDCLKIFYNLSETAFFTHINDVSQRLYDFMTT